MFEKLLQAERAMSKGQLDQAERSFWQLIEIDSQNAIAGLARVALERGDLNLSRLFADKALSLDPDSYAAKRIVETLGNKATPLPESELPDLPILAAERLEALSRHRGQEDAPIDDEEATLVDLPTEPMRDRRMAGRWRRMRRRRMRRRCRPATAPLPLAPLPQRRWRRRCSSGYRARFPQFSRREPIYGRPRNRRRP